MKGKCNANSPYLGFFPHLSSQNKKEPHLLTPTKNAHGCKHLTNCSLTQRIRKREYAFNTKAILMQMGCFSLCCFYLILWEFRLLTRYAKVQAHQMLCPPQLSYTNNACGSFLQTNKSLCMRTCFKHTLKSNLERRKKSRGALQSCGWMARQKKNTQSDSEMGFSLSVSFNRDRYCSLTTQCFTPNHHLQMMLSREIWGLVAK